MTALLDFRITSYNVCYTKLLRAVKQESDFMPRIDHLPEGIMALEFKKLYKDLDSKAYVMIDDEINRRIDECSAYK